MAVPTWMPTGSSAVEKMLGSGRTVGRGLAGLVLVAVQAVDTDHVERLHVALPHAGEGEAVEPGVVRDEAHHAPARLLGDAPLGHAEESHVEVVQPLALGLPHPFDVAIGLGQLALLVHRHAGEAVVGRIPQDDEHRSLLL